MEVAEVDFLERVFEYKVDGEKVLLPEIDPFKSPEDHLKHYCMVYPEMAISNVRYKGIVKGQAYYIIDAQPGSKA